MRPPPRHKATLRARFVWWLRLPQGGPTDIVIRIVAAKMTEQLGQQLVIDNRAAAGGSVAGEIVANAPADGYTLFAGANGTIAIAPSLFTKLPFSVAKDFTPVALVGNSPFAVMVHPGVPVEDVLLACEQAGIAFIPWYPLGAGTALKTSKVKRVAARLGATPSQVALAWLLGHSPAILPIPGTGSLEHLEENAAAAKVRLLESDLADLS